MNCEKCDNLIMFKNRYIDKKSEFMQFNCSYCGKIYSMFLSDHERKNKDLDQKYADVINDNFWDLI